MEDIRQLQQKIGYHFNDIDVLKNAVTHSSYIKEHDRNSKSNERLEFLGDAFFDAIIGEELYRSFPEKRKAFCRGQELLLYVKSHWLMKQGGWIWGNILCLETARNIMEEDSESLYWQILWKL